VNLSEEPTYFKQGDGLARVDLGARLVVERGKYFGYVPLTKVRGFRDDIEGSLITNSITTAEIDFTTLRQHWQGVESEDALAVKPVLYLGTFVGYETEASRLEDGAAR
jgi:hypothetical protein